MTQKDNLVIIENAIGWETKDGMQLAFKPEFAFMNCCRAEEHKRPIWREDQDDTR